MTQLSDFKPFPPELKVDYRPVDMLAIIRENIKILEYAPPEPLTPEEKRAVSISQKSIYTYRRVLSVLNYLNEAKVEWFHLDDHYLAANLNSLQIAASLKIEVDSFERSVKEEITAVQVANVLSKLSIPAAARSVEAANRHERRKKGKTKPC